MMFLLRFVLLRMLLYSSVPYTKQCSSNGETGLFHLIDDLIQSKLMITYFLYFLIELIRPIDLIKTYVNNFVLIMWYCK